MGNLNLKNLARQPKFAIPLVVLPFVVGLAYLFMDTDKDKTLVKPASEVVVNLPDAVDEKEQTKSQLLEQSLRQEAAQMKRTQDSIAAVEKAHRQDSLLRASAAQQSRSRRSMTRVSGSSSARTASSGKGTSEKSEFEKFKEEMAMYDRLANGQTLQEQRPNVGTREVSEEPEAEWVSRVSTDDNEYFTTIRDKREESHIHAMVDQVVKGGEGTRVRIRLLDDIEVGGERLPRGTYLYSFIGGFGQKRVMLRIKNVLVEDRIIPVDLSVYDLDANEGLYVPNSDFRVLAQQAGARMVGSSRISVDGSANSQLANMGYDMIQSLINSSTQALQKEIRKNKAKIKYNTQVILVNGKSARKKQS